MIRSYRISPVDQSRHLTISLDTHPYQVQILATPSVPPSDPAHIHHTVHFSNRQCAEATADHLVSEEKQRDNHHRIRIYNRISNQTYERIGGQWI